MKQLAALLLFLLCLGAAPAHANCTAPCTKAQIATDIATNWPDNTTQAITPALLRSTVLDLVNSYLDINGSASFTCAANSFVTAIASLSSYTCTQPTFANISGQFTLAQFPNIGANTFLGNVTSGSAVPTAFGMPSCSGASNALQYLTNTGFQCASLVSSVTPGGGLVSSITANCSQTAITTTGTLSRGDCVNAQTGTTYAIADSDRGKIITASNAAAQAYSIAQASTAGAFFSGWTTFIENNSTNVNGVVTITATTSTLCAQGTCASTYKIQPGQFARITSDGTNYQVTENAVGSQVPGTTTNDAANAGNVGEYLESVLGSGSATSVTNNTAKTIVSITLTPGDWDVSGLINYIDAASTSTTSSYASLSLVTNAIDTTVGRFSGNFFGAGVPGASTNYGIPVGPLRFSVSSNTTVFLVAICNFTVSTKTAYGIIRARRVR